MFVPFFRWCWLNPLVWNICPTYSNISSHVVIRVHICTTAVCCVLQTPYVGTYIVHTQVNMYLHSKYIDTHVLMYLCVVHTMYPCTYMYYILCTHLYTHRSTVEWLWLLLTGACSTTLLSVASLWPLMTLLSCHWQWQLRAILLCLHWL